MPLVERALEEDLRSGDVTTRAVLPRDRPAAAAIEARAPLVVCGLDVARAVFAQLDPEVRWTPHARDGDVLDGPAPLARVAGSLHALLAAERTALNFLQRLCGVATLTRRFVDAVAGTRAAIVDTRKTLPGWRALDKYAVAAGGGTNHRFALDDALLIKDNHAAAAGSPALAVKTARGVAPPHLHIQVEVESLEDARAAADAGADSLLLDNRTPAELRKIVEALGERLPLEASGGVDLHNVRSVAETGVHRISIGALTHSAPAADLALELCGDAAGGVRT